MTQLEQLLEKCLNKITSTDDIEGVLRQYPQQADQLRPLLQTALAASQHYNATPPPPPGSLAAGRARVLAEAAQRRKQIAAIPVRADKPRVRRRFALKFATALLAAVIILASVGTGIVSAAQGSLPGNVLYPTKLTIEDLRLSLNSNPAAATNLALQFGEERVREIQTLAESGQPIPEGAIIRMQNLFGYALQKASQAPPEETPGLMAQIANRTQTQAQILERLQAQGEGEQFKLQQARQSCLQIHEAAQTRMGDHPSSPPTPPAAKPTGEPAVTPGKPDTAGPTGEPVQEREQEQEQNREQERKQEQEQEQQQTQPAPPQDPGPYGTPGPHKEDERGKPEEPEGKGSETPEPKGPK